MNKRRLLLSLTTLFVFILQACNLPSGAPTEEPTPDPLIAAQMTITALAGQSTPTEIPPTLTAIPTLSSTPELTATPAFTSTPSFAYVTLSEATNCRVGPAVSFDLVDTYLVGQTIEVIGKHPFDNYWYVRSPNNPNIYCWLWGFYATGANLGNVPVLTPPPTYTPAPTANFNATYVNFGSCIGWWTRINLKNTGDLTFKSVAISLTDTVTNETRNSSLNGFQDVNACILSPITASLGPGESYTVVGPSLTADPSGHKLSATIKLCTETGQTGQCASKTIEFTP